MRKRLALTAAAVLVSLAALAVMLPARTKEPAAAADAPKTAASRITHVTVYPNSALVTREVEVPAGAGSFELVVGQLPEHTVNSSLYSEGSDGVRVLTTRFRTRPVREDTREEVRKLEDEIKRLQLAAQKITADVNTVQQNLQLLAKLENFTTASTQSATEKGKLDADAAIALAKYLMDGRGERGKELVELQQKLQANQEQQQYAQRQLNDLTAGSSKTERDAVLVVDKANAAAGKVRLNYLVDAVAWRPQYKLRAGKGAKDPVQIEYLASVVQQTGEDWSNVEMVFSTAQPMLNASPPELKVLALNVVPRDSAVAQAPPAPIPMPGRPGEGKAGSSSSGKGEGGFQGGGKDGGMMGPNPGPQSIPAAALRQPAADLDKQIDDLRKMAQQDFNEKRQESAIQLSNSAAALMQARDLMVMGNEKALPRDVGRAGKNEGPTVTYHLASKLSVPSRNDEQVVEVARLDLAPEYCYKAVPVLTRHVYRLANLTNQSKHVLLPGEATMYIGTDFVGRMDLPLVAIGEQFTAGFGVDPQVQVQRQMVEKQRSTQGGNHVHKFEYRILVSSYKGEKVKVQVWDRLPHAENETVGVSLVKATPELSKDPLYQREERPNNLLRWDVEVEPGMSGEKALAVQYEFKMELDRQMTIGNFITK